MRLRFRKAGTQAWEGIVVGKSKANLDGSNLFHYLSVQKGDGELEKVRVKRRLYNDVSEGDPLVKRAGEHPHRTSAS